MGYFSANDFSRQTSFFDEISKSNVSSNATKSRIRLPWVLRTTRLEVTGKIVNEADFLLLFNQTTSVQSNYFCSINGCMLVFHAFFFMLLLMAFMVWLAVHAPGSPCSRKKPAAVERLPNRIGKQGAEPG
jgi:hypothetical protein